MRYQEIHYIKNTVPLKLFYAVPDNEPDPLSYALDKLIKNGTLAVKGGTENYAGGGTLMSQSAFDSEIRQGKAQEIADGLIKIIEPQGKAKAD